MIVNVDVYNQLCYLCCFHCVKVILGSSDRFPTNFFKYKKISSPYSWGDYVSNSCISLIILKCTAFWAVRPIQVANTRPFFVFRCQFQWIFPYLTCKNFSWKPETAFGDRPYTELTPGNKYKQLSREKYSTGLPISAKYPQFLQ